MEYWHDLITENSLKILQTLKGKLDFILIGGWAIYFLTKQLKSKDIDIVVDFDTLEKVKSQYNINKNDNLKKYEIKIDEIDIDIYVKFYSKLIIPLEELHFINIKGLKIVKPEELLILKQGAEEARGYSEKGEKDRIDLLSLLFFYDIDFRQYQQILKKIKREDLFQKLINLIKNFKEYKYFNFTPREFKLKKNKIVKKLKNI